MPAHRSSRPRPRTATKTQPTREVEGAVLATIDGFMDLIGTRQDVPLLQAPSPHKRKNESVPLVVRALDFVGMVFANETVNQPPGIHHPDCRKRTWRL